MPSPERQSQSQASRRAGRSSGQQRTLSRARPWSTPRAPCMQIVGFSGRDQKNQGQDSAAQPAYSS
eukprot:3673873-Rhodomonas_salina.2